MIRPSSIARYLWALPTTTLGLIALIAGSRGVRVRIVEGVLEAHGPALAWMLRRLTLLPNGAAAITLGHVVLGRDQLSLDATRAHERVHVRQCEVWGPLFVPAYLVGSVVAGLRGRRFYEDNPFETEARAGARRRPLSG